MAPLPSLNAIGLVSLALTFFTPTLASIPGPFAPFPSWNVTSSAKVGNNASQLSLPGVDTSSWYTIGSKGTLMSTLLRNNVFNETGLFYSANLQNVDIAPFQVPWYYRSEGVLGNASVGQSFYTLKTNGISSRADVWLNGKLVADSNTQAGAYVGREYDVSDKLKFGGARNVLLIKVYPTNYNRDFALGFVDWNPYPPDNGTGVWRDIELKRAGQVSIGSIRVTTRAALDGAIDIYLNVTNSNAKSSASGYIDCAVYDPDGRKTNAPKSGFDLKGGETAKIDLKAKIDTPQIWWPRQWGEQPLYTVQCNASTHDGLTDASPATKFGIRTVTSTLDTRKNDTTFYVNGERFQVLGAGYTSDIFLRFDEKKVRAQFQYVLDMGINTVRLEGKQEHPFLYNLADELGIMVLAGWECCDKWEGWSYNEEGFGEKWTDADYTTAEYSMRHEASLMQTHPSILGFLVGSDYWPDDRATALYLNALKAYDWNTPVIASASQRGSPKQLPNGGMQMAGPYDWVPPNYWYDNQTRLGSAAGFGSELGAGVGTPELGSLKKFLSSSDLDDLWKEESKNKGLYHMSTNVSSFYTRQIYNEALWARYGAPTSLSDYLLKAQMMDYEATRAQFEAYMSRWSKSLTRPATGMIYWMLNNAWPSLHWNLFDYYLHPGGSYSGTKAALGQLQTAVYDYQDNSVYLVDRRLAPNAPELPNRSIDIDLIGLDGKLITRRSVDTTTEWNSARKITSVPGRNTTTSVSLLRLRLAHNRDVLSRSVYWLAPQVDVLDWDNSTWYHTPVTAYSDFKALANMTKADVDVRVNGTRLALENKSKVPAVFIRLNLVDGQGRDVVPVTWSENYITLWPGEKMGVEVAYGEGYQGVAVEMDGRNLEKKTVKLGGGH